MTAKVEEYIDEQTGMRLTIERDLPNWPRITAFAPEQNTLTIEEMNEAIKRLFALAGLPQKEGKAHE